MPPLWRAVSAMTAWTPQDDLRPYQHEAISFLHQRESAGLFLDMGLGKTAICLSALKPEHLPVLVIAPKRVAEEVWPEEQRRWRPDLTLRLITGPAAARRAELRSGRTPDITVITRDVIASDFYTKSGRDFDPDSTTPYNLLILDELSSFKSRSSKRTKAARAIRQSMRTRRVWGLTGTPASNGLLDLWAEIFLLDDGARLGRAITGYRDRYFTTTRRLPNGIPVGLEPRPGAEKAIYTKLEDLCLSMKTEGRVHLPEVTYNEVKVPLSDGVMRTYRKLRRELWADVLDIGLGREVTHSVTNAAALSSRLSQLVSGFLYPEDRDTGVSTHVHNAKLDVLLEMIEEAQGQPLLIFYRFVEEAKRIQEAIRASRSLGGTVAQTVKDPGWYPRWNQGEIPVLLSHPASIGHGMNMQSGGHTIIWMSPPWPSEHWLQGNKRLHRSGQTSPVVVHTLMSPDTVDYVIRATLDGKVSVQDGLLDHLEGVL